MSATTPDISTAPDADQAVLDALVGGARPGRASALSTVLAFGWRGMLKMKHVPEQLMDVTLMPVLMVFLFTYLFGGAIEGSTAEYLEYLLPGLLTFVLFSSIYSGVALNTDVTKGVVDRFRSLPIAPPSPLVGAVLGDIVRYSVGATVLIGVGIALGFRPEGGVAGAVAAAAVVVVFASSLSWVFSTIGLVLRAPNAVANAGNLVFFPLIFLSNVFVRPETMPGWLEAFVDVSPIAHLATVARSLMDGGVDGVSLAVVLGTAAVLTAVFAPLTTYLYRRK
jgi:ABC-2 type transport system permease protein